MGAIAVPIVPGKEHEFRAFVADLTGARKDEFADFNRRYGLSRHRAYVQETPDGGKLVVAIHDGPGGDSFMEAASASDHPFDTWFMERIGSIHGMDSSQPPPPAPELVVDA